MKSFVLILLSTWLLHPVRASLSEMTFQPAAGTLEISLRLAGDDEEWIIQSLPGGKFAADVVLQRLKRDYRIDGASYRWVGREAEAGHVWWHFEVQLTDQHLDQGECELTVRLLRDRDDRDHHDHNFYHRVNVIGIDPPVAYDFRAEQSTRRIGFAPSGR